MVNTTWRKLKKGWVIRRLSATTNNTQSRPQFANMPIKRQRPQNRRYLRRCEFVRSPPALYTIKQTEEWSVIKAGSGLIVCDTSTWFCVGGSGMNGAYLTFRCVRSFSLGRTDNYPRGISWDPRKLPALRVLVWEHAPLNRSINRTRWRRVLLSNVPSRGFLCQNLDLGQYLCYFFCQNVPYY